MTVLALEGSFASVLGGAPAAAVVFAAEVAKRTASDPRVRSLEDAVATSGADRVGLTMKLDELRAAVRAEKISEVAAEFDQIHSIQRAVEVGSVDAIIRPAEMRPRIIEAIEATMERRLGVRRQYTARVATVDAAAPSLVAPSAATARAWARAVCLATPGSPVISSARTRPASTSRTAPTDRSWRTSLSWNSPGS
jgi:hypothetical protein